MNRRDDIARVIREQMHLYALSVCRGDKSWSEDQLIDAVLALQPDEKMVEEALQKAEALQRSGRIAPTTTQNAILDGEYDAGIRAAVRTIRACLTAALNTGGSDADA